MDVPELIAKIEEAFPGSIQAHMETRNRSEIDQLIDDFLVYPPESIGIALPVALIHLLRREHGDRLISDLIDIVGDLNFYSRYRRDYSQIEKERGTTDASYQKAADAHVFAHRDAVYGSLGQQQAAVIVDFLNIISTWEEAKYIPSNELCDALRYWSVRSGII